MKDATTSPVHPRWTGVFLVCKDCSKRGNGADLKGKAVAGVVRQASRSSGERARVVLTGCLGLCPKAATAIAHVGSGTGARLIAAKSRKEIRTAVGLLTAAPAP